VGGAQNQGSDKLNRRIADMMDPMFRRESQTGRAPKRALASGLVGLLILSSCGGPDEPSAAALPAPIVPTTAAPTTVAPTTLRPTTTLAPTTTVAATTTMLPTTTALPTTTTEAPPTTLVPESSGPIAPPVDAHAAEPVIELGSIVIPKLGVDMTMYEGIRLTTLDFGPGHWPGTALPGEVGNIVVGGHRTSKHRVFRNVDQLVAGDEIIFRDENGEHMYSVNRVEIVEPTAIWIVDPTETATATLFACHPPGSTAQRIVVFADLVAG
jgi:sortase A